MISVVIPTYSRSTQLSYIVKSLPSDVEVIIVDNDKLSLSEKRNYGYRESRYRDCPSEYILFIDDDNILAEGAIDKALKCFIDKKVGIVGMMGLYQSDRNKICDAGSHRGFVTGFTYSPHLNERITKNSPAFCYYAEVDEVANAFIVKRSLMDELNGFDTKRFPIDLDEADLCYRAKKRGYHVVMCYQAHVFHNSYTGSRIPDFRRFKNAYYMGRNRILFQKKHNLSLVFTPVFVLSYVVVMIIRLRLRFIKHFLKGVRDGYRNKLESPKEYQV